MVSTLLLALATSAQMLTPAYTSVLGGEQQVYSVRFFSTPNVPAAGETVRFSNDVCGWFQNGQFAIDVMTDASGTASVTFTAFNQGLGCWITAAAGTASARYNVFTYTPIQVHIEGTVSPEDPRPAQPFSITAGAYEGAYPIYNADITARVIPGSMTATIAPATGNMGQSSLGVDFEVTPEDRTGSFEVEVAFRDFTKRFAFDTSVSAYQDMWWAGAPENGWGMSVIQHRDTLFAVIYAYDAAGKPTWYVIPGAFWTELNQGYMGSIFQPTGTPYSAYDASKLMVNAPVGTAAIVFQGASHAMLDYTINGVTGHKVITRQLFGPQDSGAPLKGLGDMWWGGTQQNGWGLAVLQQYKSLFSVWFTYDANGAPTWFVMPAGTWTTLDTYEGRLYRTMGSPWLGRVYDANALQAIDVGTFRFRFSGDTAAFDYTIDGKPGTMPLVRQGF
jgi:hypothetical protein